MGLFYTDPKAISLAAIMSLVQHLRKANPCGDFTALGFKFKWLSLVLLCYEVFGLIASLGDGNPGAEFRLGWGFVF